MSGIGRHLNYWLLPAILLIWLPQLLLNAPQENLTYGDFKRLLQSGGVSSLAIRAADVEGEADAGRVASILSPGALKLLKASSQSAHYHFVSTRAEDPGLIGQLDAAHVDYRAIDDNHWLLPTLAVALPFFILLLLSGFTGRGTHPLGSFSEVGRSRARVYVQKDVPVQFTDVEGIDEAKQELVEVVQFLQDPQRYSRLGGHVPKGILIVGGPGTGKTLLARAVAGQAGVPFLSISGSEFVEMFVGIGAARVRDLFEQASRLAPCIIFVDELDALGKARGGAGPSSNEEREQTLNQLLVEMDGFASNCGVIVLAATNRPEVLDPALLRPGRFDRHIAIDRPDIRGRERILQLHARHLVMGAGVELASIAARTPGFAGAELANVVNEAALHAARENKNAVDMTDFEAALDRVIGGLEKRNRVMNDREKETVAYHEAGHALIAEARPNADRVSKISIIPRGIGALGFTQQRPTEDRYLLKRSELLDRIDVLLAGRAAEELVYGDVSTGAQDDLQKATEIARHMVTQFGMSPRVGEITFEGIGQPGYLNSPAAGDHAAYSEHTAQVVDEEIAQLLSAAHRRDLLTLRERRGTLEALALHLLRQETVDRDQLQQLMREHAREAAV
jgi:cell division protease FtsH